VNGHSWAAEPLFSSRFWVRRFIQEASHTSTVSSGSIRNIRVADLRSQISGAGANEDVLPRLRLRVRGECRVASLVWDVAALAPCVALRILEVPWLCSHCCRISPRRFYFWLVRPRIGARPSGLKRHNPRDTLNPGRDGFHPSFLRRRVAQAFDLAGITNTAGAPSFAFFAKGGRNSETDGTFPYFPQVYVISTPNRQVPASFAALQRFSFALRFWCRYFGTSLNPSFPATSRPPTIALRWFSEFSEISTVFR
jgi:hypothetical protein